MGPEIRTVTELGDEEGAARLTSIGDNECQEERPAIMEELGEDESDVYCAIIGGTRIYALVWVFKRREMHKR